MSARKFNERLDLIKCVGLKVAPLPEAMHALREGRLAPNVIAITIDDGWASTYTHMLPALERARFPATVYVQTAKIETQAPVTDVAIRYAVFRTNADSVDLRQITECAGGHTVVAEAPLPLTAPKDKNHACSSLDRIFLRTPTEHHWVLLECLYQQLAVDFQAVRRNRCFQLLTTYELNDAAQRGFEIALHTHTHDLGDFSETRILNEIASNRTSLSAILGAQPDSFRHFCWPSGEYSAAAIRTLTTAGIDLATTCDPGLAGSNSSPLVLPRILDGERVSTAAFMLELSGLKTRLRELRGSRFGRNTQEPRT